MKHTISDTVDDYIIWHEKVFGLLSLLLSGNFFFFFIFLVTTQWAWPYCSIADDR